MSKQTDDEILYIISNETKEEVEGLNIVTPSMYSSIFRKHANSHNTDLDNETKITNAFLDGKIFLFENMQNKTSKHILKLSESTSRAISAIHDKDEDLLKKVLHETKELRREIEKLKENLYTDELTNSYNRKWLQDNILKTDTKMFKYAGVLALIDLNYFKSVNDTFGHVIGDKVLVFITNQLKEMRENVIRYGGDEFIIIFSKNITKKMALSKLDKLREDILKKKLKSNSKSFRISFSFGVREFKENDDLTDILELADNSMYDDKVQIKKRVKGI